MDTREQASPECRAWLTTRRRLGLPVWRVTVPRGVATCSISAILSGSSTTVCSVAQTVLAHLLRCGISESQAREHLAAGQVRVNCVPVSDADAELPDADDTGTKPTVVIYPF